MQGVVKRYSRRHYKMRLLSLAEFATFYDVNRGKKNKDNDENFVEDDEKGWQGEENGKRQFYNFRQMYIIWYKTIYLF